MKDSLILSKYNESTGFWWKRKKDKKQKGGSQTPGKTKGENCKTSHLEKYFAKSSRSYKHPGYVEWLEKTRIKKIGEK